MSHELLKIPRQGSLFPINPRDICKRMGLPWWVAIKLYENNLISFDPEKTTEPDESQQAELCFVGALIAANCPPDMLRELLSGLTAPYSYSHSSIYYDWISKQWKPLPEPPDQSDMFYQWVSELSDAEDVATLKEIQAHVEGLLETLPPEE